jgi:hypothetical protein
MDVAKLVQSIHRAEHFGNVEPGVAVREDTSIVEEGSEVSTRDIFL